MAMTVEFNPRVLWKRSLKSGPYTALLGIARSFARCLEARCDMISQKAVRPRLFNGIVTAKEIVLLGKAPV